MTNIPQIARMSLKSKNDTRLPYSQKGWEDARNGVEFDYRLTDTVGRAYAHAYELARHRVLALQASGIVVPAWRACNTLPPKVAAAIKRATEINVDCLRQGIPVFYATKLNPDKFYA